MKITPDGYEIVRQPKMKFVYDPGMNPLLRPVSCGDGDISRLEQFVSADHENYLRTLAWLISAMCPFGPYPILALTASRGSGKSTFARVLRSIIDPNKTDLESDPRDERDIMIAAQSSLMLAYDNLTYLPEGGSDMFCRIATGCGFKTRKLWANGELTTFNACCPILLTSIGGVVNRADLLSRSFQAKLGVVASVGTGQTV